MKKSSNPQPHKPSLKNPSHKQPHKPSPKSTNYLQLSNEQYLRRMTQAMFQKQSKCSLQSQLFPKHQTNPTSTKQFFFISFFCLEKLASVEEIQGLRMWYPPRNVGEQLEFKKAFFALVQSLQTAGKLPRNFLVSKGAIMGDAGSAPLVEFLRFLSEMALRHQYLQKYSKRQKLIQIKCNNSQLIPQNNINKFYTHPFVPSQSPSQSPPNTDLALLKQVYHTHIKIYLKKLTKLRTKDISPILSQQYHKLMKQYMEQKQLSQTLKARVPASLLSENRAFDRRRIIDRSEEIWGELAKLECNFVEERQIPVLQIQGEIDQLLEKWQPVKGIGNIIQANTLLNNLSLLNKKLTQQMNKLGQITKNVQTKIKTSI